MKYLKERTALRINTIAATKFLALAGVITVLPFLIHVQWLSGPIINAILILTLFLVGIRAALVVSLIPSITALAGGLLPAVFMPMVPFIMFSNIILVLSVDYFYNNAKSKFNGYFLGIFFGSLLKFLFLFFNTILVIKIIMKEELAVKVAQMMSWPQFFTALTGGVLAFIVLKWLKKI